MQKKWVRVNAHNFCYRFKLILPRIQKSQGWGRSFHSVVHVPWGRDKMVLSFPAPRRAIHSGERCKLSMLKVEWKVKIFKIQKSLYQVMKAGLKKRATTIRMRGYRESMSPETSASFRSGEEWVV